MEMTVEQLAAHVAMSVRNIREWQTLGLIPPPARRGRIGIYGDDHVAVINRVKKLRAEGFPLDIIRRMAEAGDGAENSVQQMAKAALSPFATAQAATMARSELVHRLGTNADAALERFGLVTTADSENVLVRDVDAFEALCELVGSGLNVDHLIDTLTEIAEHQRAIAALILQTYVADVWQPFVASGFTSPDWGTMAANASDIRPLALRLLLQTMNTAMDEEAERVMVIQAGSAGIALDATVNFHEGTSA